MTPKKPTTQAKMSSKTPAKKAANNTPKPGLFAQRLREWRQEKGVTGWQIEQQTGVPRQTISNIEAGRRPASDDVLHKLAALPQMDITYETLRVWKLLDEVADQDAIKQELLRQLQNEE